MSVSLANQTTPVWPNSTAAQTFTIAATTIGNILVVIFASASAAGRTVTPSLGGVTTWTRSQTSNTTASVDMWAGIATSSATTITLTASTGNVNNWAYVLEFSSTTGWNVSPIGNHAPQTNASSTSAPTASITPAESNDLIVAAVDNISNRTYPTSPSSPWSNITGAASGHFVAAWQQQGTAASISTSWTTSVAVGTDTVIGAFIAAVAAADPPFNLSQPSSHYINSYIGV